MREVTPRRKVKEMTFLQVRKLNFLMKCNLVIFLSHTYTTPLFALISCNKMMKIIKLAMSTAGRVPLLTTGWI